MGSAALAILVVVAFHVHVPGFSGGFVGVDVFFVISGFLITGLLSNELDSQKRISLTNFYARRIRRLLPALFVVSVVTLVIGAFGRHCAADTTGHTSRPLEQSRAG